MVAANEAQMLVGALCQGELRRRDAVRPVQSRIEGELSQAVGEEAEHGRRAVVGAEAAAPVGVGDEAALALADEGGAGEGGWDRWEVEEDLPEDVVVVWQRRWRRQLIAHQNGG